jgi:hypothetical protein
MLGGLLAGVIVSRLRRPTTSDPASALRGIVAERDLQLHPRDSRVTEKNQAKEERDVERGRALRQSGGQHS